MTRPTGLGWAVVTAIAIAFILTCVYGGKSLGAEVRTSSGLRVHVSDAMRKPAQCLIDGIERKGHRIRAMRGYGHGTVRHSLHPSGNAIDIDQYSRNVARLPRYANAVARSCGLITGGDWKKRPDFGHFQLGGWNGKRSVSIGVGYYDSRATVTGTIKVKKRNYRSRIQPKGKVIRDSARFNRRGEGGYGDSHAVH